METAYSLDGGTTFSIYTEPIVISDKRIDKIFFYSVDKAGNNEEIKEFDLNTQKPKKCIDKKCHVWNKKHDKIRKHYKGVDLGNRKLVRKFIKLKFKIK